MNMQLRTLGALDLDTTSFTERLPLFLLTYLALEGKTHRNRLADLFWIHKPDVQKRLQGLSETLYRLKKINNNLVTISDDYVFTNITTDAQVFEKEKDAKVALGLYRGPFLANLERNKRLKLSEELTEWIFNKRESLQTRALSLQLEYAEELAFNSQFDEAANVAWQAFTASTAIAYPNQSVYRRTHNLILAAEQMERAATLEQEMSDLYGGDEFLFNQPFKARAYLTHTFNLRPQEDELIDRDKDVRAVLALLEHSRLVTIYGPPGVGKTSLAQVLAKTARGQAFASEGIYIAYFESLPQDAPFDSLMRVIGEALGIAPGGKTLTLEDLGNFVADKPQLLILDNFEHVAKEGKQIIKHLHETCQELRTVVTSRQHLKLSHEKIFTLEPLSFPRGEAVSLETIHSYAAVKLFEYDAKKYGFELNAETLEDIIKVCQMVEGLPLALKLAAAWTNTLTTRQIAQRLEKDFDLLSLGTQDTIRHSSIRATFDHSITLLPQEEAKSLVNLGVYENGFTLEAAQKVTQTDVFTLRNLVEKSLLRFEGEKGRYGFHPLLDRYIKERFGKYPEKEALEAAHARYYLDLLDTVIDEEGNERGEVLPVLRLEVENIEKAWRYATDHSWVDELFRSSRALQNFSTLTVQYSFADKLLTYSLGKTPEDAINLRTALMANLSAIRFWIGNFDDAVNLARSAYQFLEKSNVDPERVLSITRLILGVMQSSYASMAKFTESIKVARELVSFLKAKVPNTAAYSNALGNLAIHEGDLLGNYDPQLFYEALSIAETQAKTDVPWLLVNLAESLIKLGELTKAEEATIRAKELAKQMQQGHWLALSQYRLAKVKLYQGNIWEALQIVYPLLDEVKKHSKRSLTAIVYQLIGKIEMTRGNSWRAWDYFMQALSEANSIKSISLTNSIKMDLLDWTVKEKDSLAFQLTEELEKETARMYFHDREKFTNLFRALYPSGRMPNN